MNLTVKNITKVAPIALGLGLAMAPIDYSASISDSIENAKVSILTPQAFACGGGSGGRGGASGGGSCPDPKTPEKPEEPTEPKSEKEESETRKCNYKIDFVKGGMVAVGKGAGLNGSDRIVTPKNAKWLRVGKRITFEIPGTVQNEHNWCAYKIGTLHGYYSKVGWNGKTVKSNNKGTAPSKRGSVYVAPKPLPKNSTVLSYGACVNNSAIEKIRGEVKKRTLSSEARVRNEVRDVTKSYNGYTYPVTDAQLADLKVEDCSTYAFSRKDDVICTFPTEDGSAPAIAFAKGASCSVKEEKPAAPVQKAGQACDAKVITASMYFNQAPVNNVVTATVNGVVVNGEMIDEKVVEFKGNQIIGIDCNNNIEDGLDAYANIVATTQTSTFLERGDNGKHKNLSLNKQFHGVVKETCVSVENICKKAQSTNGVLGLPIMPRQTMARKNG